MLEIVDTFTIGQHYVSALINGDESGLTTQESRNLDLFLIELPKGHKVYSLESEAVELSWCEVDEITSACVSVGLYMETKGNL